MLSMRDLGCPEWTLLVVILLVCSCPGPGLSCHGDKWAGSRALDLESLAAANVTLAVLGVFHSVDRDACADLCCQNTSGICTVASFQTTTGESNDTCYLYTCLPSHLCFLTTRNGTDTLLISFPDNAIEPASTTSAVHGDGTQSKGRKGVLSLEVEDVPLKHDNTTVKPRKGVLKEHLVNTVKARKGVENETLMISTDLFSDDVTVSNSSYDDSLGLTPLVVRLEDVVTNTSLGEQNTTESTPISIVWYERDFNSSKDDGMTNITVILLSNLTSSVPSTKKDFEMTVETLTTILPSSTLSPSTSSSSFSSSPSSSSPSYSSSSTRKPTTYLTSVREDVATSVATSSQVTVNSESQNSGEVSDWEAETGATSMHLVIGLVLGLMLLLTVLGIVAKRIHDSWQRRHYHRMDFLIDGMYHGEA